MHAGFELQREAPTNVLGFYTKINEKNTVLGNYIIESNNKENILEYSQQPHVKLIITCDFPVLNRHNCDAGAHGLMFFNNSDYPAKPNDRLKIDFKITTMLHFN